MMKVAKPSHYELVKAKLDQGDKQIQSQMSTMSPAELGWGLMGAGLGAGGGYLVSRMLRPRGTKRQRAFDILIGGLVGASGSALMLNGLTDDKTGFTLGERLRADQIDDLTGNGGRDYSDNGMAKATDAQQQALQSIRHGLFVGGGAVGGAILGGILGPAEGALESWSSKRLLAQLEAAANKNWPKYVKQTGLKNPTAADQMKYIENYKAVGASKSMAPKRMARFGRALDIVGGGILGGFGGHYLDKYLGEKILATTGSAA